MRNITLIISILLFTAASITGLAQGKPQHYTYYQYEYSNEGRDTTTITVDYCNREAHIQQVAKVKNPIPGYAEEHTYVDFAADSVYYQYRYSDSTYYRAAPLKRKGLEWDTQYTDTKTVSYTTNINSNTIELVFATNRNADVNPLPYFGHFDGVMLRMVRNGQVRLELGKTEQVRKASKEKLIPSDLGIRKSSREIGDLGKKRMILTTRVFDNEQIHWGAPSCHVDAMPYDTTLHFAGGTLIMKRLRMPKLPRHYQTFIELRQRSNGDAYDRTGSVFVIPGAGNPLCPTFFDGINGHPDSLPTITGKDGQQYQGIISAFSHMQKYHGSSLEYRPPVELMRFFTPFGIGKYNDRVHIEGLEWAEETFYKQEVTDLTSVLEGDVWIGCFIGNYDAGGHLVTLDIKSYPNDYEWDRDKEAEPVKYAEPLVNTCNVLEMAGQNYGKIFGTDSITITIKVTERDSLLTLRYISTGHGGWDDGDEFVPKENKLLVDGEVRYRHTPWRSDCGRYREWNPVSGNFWNGLSSSDYSRSGWCPGTATQPVYFDLSSLEPGTHTLTIAIPQGPPIEGGFSHWNVSATLLRTSKKTNSFSTK